MRTSFPLSSLSSVSPVCISFTSVSSLKQSELRSDRRERVCDREALRQHGTYFLYFHCLSMLISFSYLLAFISCSMVSLVLSCYALNSAEPCAGLVYPIVEILPPPYTLRPPPVLLFAIRLMIFEIATGDKSLDLVIPVFRHCLGFWISRVLVFVVCLREREKESTKLAVDMGKW